jgi:hypothetical protein
MIVQQLRLLPLRCSEGRPLTVAAGEWSARALGKPTDRDRVRAVHDAIGSPP